MSFIVKNMDIPKSCKQCIEKGLRSVLNCSQWQYVSVENSNVLRAENCPLVEIPDEHGGLLICGKGIAVVR